MTRIANFAQSQRNIGYILDTQKRLALGQFQASSGKKAENYSGIASDTRRLINLESAHVRATQHIANNSLIEDRLQMMESSVAQIFDAVGEYKTLLVNALNANNSNDLAMPVQTQALMDQIASLLNAEQDGRFLFSGTRTDTTPVDLTQLPITFTIPTADGDASAYYQGDSVKLTAQADENFTVTYGVTADEVGFEQAIRAMQMVIVGPPNDRATMDEALRVITQAIDSVSNIRTEIGASRKALENANSRHDEFLLFAEKTISDLENADVTKVITEMNADQVVLEASFATLGRLSQLTLTNYLR